VAKIILNVIQRCALTRVKRFRIHSHTKRFFRRPDLIRNSSLFIGAERQQSLKGITAL
jgi:hypothetical protein